MHLKLENQLAQCQLSANITPHREHRDGGASFRDLLERASRIVRQSAYLLSFGEYRRPRFVSHMTAIVSGRIHISAMFQQCCRGVWMLHVDSSEHQRCPAFRVSRVYV